MQPITIGKYTIQLIWDSREEKPIGTGFSFLRPDWIVTARHIIEISGFPRQHLKAEFIRSWPTDPGGPTLDAEVYAWHPELDVAVLRVTEPNPCEMPLLPSYVRFTGQEGLYSIGYRPSLTVQSNPGYCAEVNLVQKWEIERRTRKSVEEAILFPSEYVEGGHSGGPLLGLGGGVVGIVVEAIQSMGEPYARGTSILSLLDGLEMCSQWRPPAIENFVGSQP
jgi:hypothetical protein